MHFHSFVAGIIALVFLCVACSAKRNWDYEPMSVNGSTSDASKMLVDAQVGREKRGTSTLSATFGFNYDMDNDTLIDIIGYRSATGNDNDYQLVPWSVPKQTYEDFLKNYYNDLIYPNFGSCSNLPKPGNEWPWPKMTIKLDKCVATGQGMPEIAPEGYYKIIFTVTGEVDWGFILYLRVTSKNNMMGY